MAVHHGSVPATSAGFRPRTSSPSGVPNDFVTRFQTSSAPGRAEARYLLVSNSYYEPSPNTLCCHAPVAIPPIRILCKYYTATGVYCTSYFGLCCGTLLRIAQHTSAMVTDTGIQNPEGFYKLTSRLSQILAISRSAHLSTSEVQELKIHRKKNSFH
jgi:hypothetical protein